MLLFYYLLNNIVSLNWFTREAISDQQNKIYSSGNMVVTSINPKMWLFLPIAFSVKQKLDKNKAKERSISLKMIFISTKIIQCRKMSVMLLSITSALCCDPTNQTFHPLNEKHLSWLSNILPNLHRVVVIKFYEWSYKP